MDAPSELHPADPRLRRHARWLPAAVLAGGAVGLWALHRWLAGLPHGTVTTDALLLAFLGLGVVIGTTALTLAWLLWQAAVRVLAEDCYPPSTMRTLTNVPRRRGPAARRAARVLRAAALLAALLGFGVVAWIVATLQGAA